MSRPSKHPKTGIYQLRKVVPEDLRKFVGKHEEKVSLQTRDPAEAKVRHASKRLTSADLEYLYDLSRDRSRRFGGEIRPNGGMVSASGG